MATQIFHRNDLNRNGSGDQVSEEYASEQLSQAARFVTHLQLQLAELDRREQQLNSQLSSLIEKQQAAKREGQQLAEKISAAERKLNERDRQLADSENRLREQSESLVRQAEELRQLQMQVQQERAKFEQESRKQAIQDDQSLKLLQQKETEYSRLLAEMQRSQREAEAELASKSQEITRLQNECRVHHDELQVERSRFAEVQQERTKFEQESRQRATEGSESLKLLQSKEAEYSQLLADQQRRQRETEETLELKSQEILRLQADYQSQQAELEVERSRFAAVQQQLAELESAAQQRFQQDAEALRALQQKESEYALLFAELQQRQLEAESLLDARHQEIARLQGECEAQEAELQLERARFREAQLESEQRLLFETESKLQGEAERVQVLTDRENQLKAAEASLFERTGALAQQAEEIREQREALRQERQFLEQELQQRFAEEMQKAEAVRQADFAEREAQLAQLESSFATRVSDLEQVERSLLEQQEQLRVERAELETVRSTVLVESQQKLVAEQDQLAADRAALIAEREQLVLEYERLFDEVIKEKASLQESSNRLQAEFEAKFEAEKNEFRQAIATSELSMQADLELAKNQFVEQQETRQQTIIRHEEESRKLIEQERVRILSEIEEQQNAIHRERLELHGQREEQDRLNQQWAEHRRTERREHLQELEEISRERLAKLDLREAELERREVDFQKRFTLHESHLEKTRKELVSQKDTIAWQQQQHRVWAEKVEQSVQLRLSQIRRFRDLMSQREKCLADEQQLFERQRKETEDLLAMQREGLLSERQQFVEMKFRERELLDEQQTRLVTETNQFIEICGQLNPLLERFHSVLSQFETRPDPLGEAADDSAPSLDDVVVLLSEQILAMERTQRVLSSQQSQYREVVTRFTEWMEQRETRLCERETLFTEQLQELKLREHVCQQERDQWHRERIEVEQVIRDLVLRVEQAWQSAAEVPTVLPDPPSANAA
ncbi:hypothetical protein [Planctomicrobium sp. SH527]|uniref:hypothetical protein n=1 Tax=Planctomicrobium sp. SH527 TaxID=3448123 RepID=UPI003F5C1B73